VALTGRSLTDQERAILDFEASWWQLDVPKDVAVAERFGLDPDAYDDALIELADRPEAAEHDRLLIARLQRWRDRQRRSRREGAHA
jgi:Protein of unknown function (DUF3263)